MHFFKVKATKGAKGTKEFQGKSSVAYLLDGCLDGGEMLTERQRVNLINREMEKCTY